MVGSVLVSRAGGRRGIENSSQISLAQASAALSKLFLKSSSPVVLKTAAASIAVLMGAGEMQR